MSDPVHSRTLRISIRCAPQHVYAFVSNPERLPRWATSFCKSVRPDGDDWIVETRNGDVRVWFTEPNAYGVVDHVVTLPSGKSANFPMRIVPNGSGSEVLFTLFRPPTMTDGEFARDCMLVQKDLETLQQVLEGQSQPV